MLQYLIGLIFLSWNYCVSALEFPNTVMSNPRVECQVDSVKLAVETSSGNPSHMFVKGRHHESACIIRNNNMIVIKHESCGLSRERSLNPPGVYYKVCVVVQLHPQFITKVDRTFCASCFYMESVKELTNELGVSVMSSTEVAVSFPMPACTYTIRRGSATGPEIKFATVGEPVFHVWSCPSDSYGALVQNCYVDDGQGNRILIIDQNGCGIDRYIIQTPVYNGEINTASQESHVFKFADKMITRFTCQIKICIKAGNGCRGITPPENCPLPVSGGGVRSQTPPVQTNAYQQRAGGGASYNSPPSYSRDSNSISSYSNVSSSVNQTATDSTVSLDTRSTTTVKISTTTTTTTTIGTKTEQPVIRPAFFNKARMGNRFRNVRSSNDREKNEFSKIADIFDGLQADSVNDDFVDVVGELFVMENAPQTDERKLYEELSNAMVSGASLKWPLRPDNSVCLPTTGFATVLLLFVSFVACGLVTAVILSMRNRRITQQMIAKCVK